MALIRQLCRLSQPHRIPATPPADFYQRLLPYALLFMAVFGLVTMLNKHVSLYRAGTNQAVYGDVRGYVAAAQKARLGQDPYLQADSGYAARNAPEVWQRMGLEPGARVYPYIYPPLLAELLAYIPANVPRAAIRWNYLILLSILSLAALGWRAWRHNCLLAWAAIVVVATAAGSKPVLNCFLFGQVNTFLGAALGWSLYLVERPAVWKRVAGYALAGFGFWLKLIPVAFSGLQALRDRLAIRRLAGIAGGVAAIGIVVAAAQPWLMGDWLAFLARGSNTLQPGEKYFTYGIPSMELELLPYPGLLIGLEAIAALLTGLGIWLAYRRGGVLWHYQAMLPLSAGLFLLTPVAWDHHLAFYILPALLGMFAFLAQRGGRLSYLLVGLGALWLAGPKLDLAHSFWLHLVLLRITAFAGLAVLAVFNWLQLQTPNTARHG